MEVTLGGDGAPADRVATLLKGLNLSCTPSAQAGIVQLYSELKSSYEAQECAAPAEYTADQDEDVKQACKLASLFFVARVLYAQEQDGEQHSGNLGCSISRIVTAAGINLLDFFREVNVVVSRLSTFFEARNSSSKLFSQQAQLKENSETVVVMGLLAKKYKDNFNTFLHQLDYYKQVVLRLGWNAFLVLRVKLLSAFPDVVSCVELLPCIFAILASHAPRLPDSLSHIKGDERASLLLKCMSEMCKADFKRVQARMPSVEALLIQIFTSAVPEWRTAMAEAKAQAAQPAAAGSDTPSLGAGLDLVSSPVLKGLVTDHERMNRVVAALEQEYDQHYSRGGHELDEREFLSTDFTKFASPRFSPGQMHSVMSKFRGGPMPLRPGSLLGPGAHMTAPAHTSSHPLHMMMPPGLHSPLPMMHLGVGPGQPGTPVSEAMGASAWLRGVTSSLAAEPSPALQRFLTVVPAAPAAAAAAPAGPHPAPSSVAQQLSRRVRDMVAAVIPDETVPSLLGPFPLLQPSLGAERRSEAIKLYYLSLESILVAEEKASGLSGAMSLLSSTKFHRGLIACCVEIVAACYRMVSCAFPKVLDSLRIKAFDMAKMIQSFVKSVSTLPRELKRHMFLIEEKILESLAWEPGSSLYHLIVNVRSENDAPPPAPAAASAAQGAAPAAANSSGGSEEQQHTDADGSKTDSSAVPGPPPSPKRTQASAFTEMMSPAKKARGVDGAAHATQIFTQPLPSCIGPRPQGATAPGGSAGALYEFCRKVLKLSAFRLAMMCDNFDFSPLDRVEVNSKVYETIEHALFHQTHLYYNRHIDQVMLSALYGYCKAHKLAQVSFREIIAHYRKQPQAQQAVFRSVVIEQSNPGLQIGSRADIIAFYNQVFVPAMKSFLLKGESGGVGGDTPVPPPAPTIKVPVPGLPPLPRSASHSPRGPPRLPPTLSAPLPATSQQDSHEGRESADKASVVRDGGGKAVADGVKVEVASAMPHAPASRISHAAPVAHPPSNSQMGSVAGTRHAPQAAAAVQGAAGTQKGPGARAKAAPAAEHKIPDGLAALLQALDSQQGADNQADGEEGEPAEQGDEGAAMGLDTSMTMAARERAVAAGRERRSARFLERREEDHMDTDPRVAAPAGEHIAMAAGRRHRTPNRRYDS
ncbi:hypothetical protein Agub_g4220 [Astrephomene gubernaculifera]|uniref:Retinoblastoma-like protein n=1 Tax=Astrephomene gubernaculifera TaxID=47775 RepID=A0AAD3DJT2_9CHLO|nr:hypothetical protein Agub_g4220 [Astrephomene gubernaculifera]